MESLRGEDTGAAEGNITFDSIIDTTEKMDGNGEGSYEVQSKEMPCPSTDGDTSKQSTADLCTTSISPLALTKQENYETMKSECNVESRPSAVIKQESTTHESLPRSSECLSTMTFESLAQASEDVITEPSISSEYPNDNINRENAIEDSIPKASYEKSNNVQENTAAEIKVEDGEEIVHFKVEPSLLSASYREDGTEDSSSDSSDSTDSDDSSADSSDDETSDMDRPEKLATSKPMPIKTKGEFSLQDLPPIEELKIDVDDSVSMRQIGKVSQILGTLVVIQQYPNLPALNEDTVLFMEGRTVLGQIFEVFGPVPQPCYSVRFNSEEDIKAKGLTVGQVVTCAPEAEDLTHYVFVEQLKRLKGSDASWEHNNEPPLRFLDFSDDEEEQRMKARMRGRGGEPGSEGGDEASDTTSQIPKRKKNRRKKQQGSGDKESGFSEGSLPSAHQRWPPNPWNQGPPPRGMGSPAWSPWGPPRPPHFIGVPMGMPRPRSRHPRPRHPQHVQRHTLGWGHNPRLQFQGPHTFSGRQHPMQPAYDSHGDMLSFPPPRGPAPHFVPPQQQTFVPQTPPFMTQSGAPQIPPVNVNVHPMMDSRLIKNDQGLGTNPLNNPFPSQSTTTTTTRFGEAPSFQPGPLYR